MFEQLRAKYRRRVRLTASLICLMWVVVVIAPTVFTALAYVVQGTDFDEEATFGTNAALTWLALSSLAPAGVIGGLPYLFFGSKLIRLQLSAREPNERESPVREALDRLALATGRPAPSLVIIDDKAVNAGAMGTSRRPVVMVTTGAAQLPDSELESLLALALARLATGHTFVSRMYTLVSGPNLIWLAILRFIARKPLILLAVPISWVLTIGSFFAFDDETAVTGWEFVPFVFIFLGFMLPIAALFVGPIAVPMWIGIQVLTRLAVRRMMAPASLDLDVGAVSLTRYPVPLVALLTRAAAVDTKLGFWALGTGGLWCLPQGANKIPSLNRRLAALSEFAHIETAPVVAPPPPAQPARRWNFTTPVQHVTDPELPEWAKGTVWDGGRRSE